METSKETTVDTTRLTTPTFPCEEAIAFQLFYGFAPRRVLILLRWGRLTLYEQSTQRQIISYSLQNACICQRAREEVTILMRNGVLNFDFQSFPIATKWANILHASCCWEVSDFYYVEGLIGSGTFGKVNRGEHKKSGAKVAIKKIKYEDNPVPNELEIMLLVRHKNLLRAHDVLASPKHFHVACELMSGDLWHKYVVKGPTVEGKVQILMTQVLTGMEHLHGEMRILHRDIKSCNILVNTKDMMLRQVRIADFGSAIRSDTLSVSNDRFRTTWMYAAPEVWNREAYTDKSDMFAVGCVLYELLTGLQAFGQQEMGKGKVQIQSGLIHDTPEWRNVSECGRDLVMKLLSLNPVKRPSATECLSHEFFKEKKSSKSDGPSTPGKVGEATDQI